MKNAVYTPHKQKKISQRKMFALFYIIQFATATVKRNIKMRTYENAESVGTYRVEWSSYKKFVLNLKKTATFSKLILILV